MSHTPAPWILDTKERFGNIKTNIMTEEGYAIADIAINYSSIEDEKEHEANANLIIAAPELLEALKGFVEVIKMNCFAQKKNIKSADANQINWQSFYEPAIEALAKAEGK